MFCLRSPVSLRFLLSLSSHEQNRTNSLPRRDLSRGNPRSRTGDFSLSRMSGGSSQQSNISQNYFGPPGSGANSMNLQQQQPSGGHWTDSLPRRDFYNLGPNSTGSLPRRDKAGLGRPEPSSMVPGSSSTLMNGQGRNGGIRGPRDLSLGRNEGGGGGVSTYQRSGSTGGGSNGMDPFVSKGNYILLLN